MDALTSCKNMISKSEHEFKSGLVFWTRSGVHCNHDGDASICLEEFFREASACLIRVIIFLFNYFDFFYFLSHVSVSLGGAQHDDVAAGSISLIR